MCSKASAECNKPRWNGSKCCRDSKLVDEVENFEGQEIINKIENAQKMEPMNFGINEEWNQTHFKIWNITFITFDSFSYVSAAK